MGVNQHEEMVRRAGSMSRDKAIFIGISVVTLELKSMNR